MPPAILWKSIVRLSATAAPRRAAGRVGPGATTRPGTEAVLRGVVVGEKAQDPAHRRIHVQLGCRNAVPRRKGVQEPADARHVINATSIRGAKVATT